MKNSRIYLAITGCILALVAAGFHGRRTAVTGYAWSCGPGPIYGCFSVNGLRCFTKGGFSGQPATCTAGAKFCHYKVYSQPLCEGRFLYTNGE